MHRLTSFNDEAKTADCSVCGPAVPVYVNFSSTQQTWQRQCVKSVSDRRKAGVRAEEDRTDHRLSDIDEQTMSATCSQCGPATPVARNRLGLSCRYSRTISGHRTRAKRLGYEALSASSDELADKLKAQEGRCGSCGRDGLALVPDHCHVTGQLRGWLCKNCNLGIGHLGDTLEALERAVDYLQRAAEEKNEIPT